MIMNNAEYTAAVDRGDWPSFPTVPLDAPFVNANGSIQNLVLKPMQSVTALTSVKGAVRANHYHKTDWHYTYVSHGTVLYLCRPIGSKDIPAPIVYKAGSLFFTPPLLEHAMVFAEDSVIITMAKNVRSHDEHESDLVRVEFVTPEMALGLVRGHAE
jgi:quercetin dioxygenase-like cupin family protein